MKALIYSASLLFACCLVACDDDDSPAGDTFVGEWALRRSYGGIAGTDTTYSSDDPPAILAIGADSSFAFRYGEGRGGIPAFTTFYSASLQRVTDEGRWYILTFADPDLEGTGDFTGGVRLAGDELNFYNARVFDGFGHIYVRD